MKKNTFYKISRNIYLIEKYFKDPEQFGFIELFENGRIEISIKKNAKPWVKVLGLHHELSHLVEFLVEDAIEKHKNENKRISKSEKIACLISNIVAWVANHIDWYIEGIKQLQMKPERLTTKNLEKDLK